MTAPHPTVLRRTGAAAVAAGLLLFASVAAELVRPVQRPDGTVTDTSGFALYLAVWTLGAAALVVSLTGLRRVGPLGRAGRIGLAVSLAGAALLTAFGAVALGSAAVDGDPAEWSFLLFAVGLLLLSVGSVPLALGLRRGALGGWWVALLVAGAGGLVALGASADPWHDLGLFVLDAAWMVFGLRLLTVPVLTGARVPTAG